MRVVLDTNVLLAAFGTRGLCEALFAACLERHELVASEHILGELREHLGRVFRISPRQTEVIVAFVRERCEVVTPASVKDRACRDPDDLPILGTAVAGRADLLVTGDKDLLQVAEYEGIPIVTPRQCYERWKASPAP